MRRIARSFELFDGLRLDHFIGYYRTWEVNARHKTARRGRWVAGPREDFFKRLFRCQSTDNRIAQKLQPLKKFVAGGRVARYK
jgi:4-alpha-glucanotransferase